MSWVVADPKVAAVKGIVVQEVEVQAFPDDAKFLEDLADKILTNDRLKENPVVLVTPKGFVAMHQLSRTAHLLGPAALAKMLFDLATQRQLVCLRWSS